MTYGIFALDSGTALAWYESSEAAFHAVLEIVAVEPDAVESLGLMAFDDEGNPGDALQGQELINAASGVAA